MIEAAKSNTDKKTLSEMVNAPDRNAVFHSERKRVGYGKRRRGSAGAPKQKAFRRCVSENMSLHRQKQIKYCSTS